MAVKILNKMGSRSNILHNFKIMKNFFDISIVLSEIRVSVRGVMFFEFELKHSNAIEHHTLITG